jgi:GNAT superfamily N-acetyltransferase
MTTNNLNDPLRDSALNLFAYIDWLGGLPCCHLEWDGVLGRLAVGAPLSDLNWVINAAPIGPDISGPIKRTLDFYARQGLPFSWYPVGAGYESSLVEALAAHGGRSDSDLACMASGDMIPVDLPPLQEGISIATVSAPAGLEDWARAAADGFGYPESVQASFTILATHMGFPGPDHRLYLARVDDQPAGTALLFRTGQVAGLYFLAVTPTMRRRGLGLALTRRAMHDALQADCRMIILQSSQMAENLYHRAGFRTFAKMGRVTFEGDQRSIKSDS